MSVIHNYYQQLLLVIIIICQLVLWCHLLNRRVAALRARTAAIYRTKEVPHTLPIVSRSRVIVDHHMFICQTGRPVACAQCSSRTEAHCSASLHAWRFSAAHCSASLRAWCFSAAHCSASLRAVRSRTDAPSNGLRKYHRRERHDGTTARRHDGTTARRHDGTTARRHDGTTARRHDGTTARRHDGTTARRHDGTTARRHDGTTARRHDGTTARRHDGTTARPTVTWAS